MSEKKPQEEEVENEEEINPIKKMVTYTTSSSSEYSFTGLDILIAAFAVGFGLSLGVVSGYNAANWSPWSEK